MTFIADEFQRAFFLRTGILHNKQLLEGLRFLRHKLTAQQVVIGKQWNDTRPACEVHPSRLFSSE
jgi:hypothetical protein